MLTKLLGQVTMYRLMLYYLFALYGYTFLLSTIGRLPYSPIDIFLHGGVLVFFCKSINYVLSKFIGAKTNLESDGITALILALLITPLPVTSNLFLLFLVSALAMCSKYALAVRKKHIFNPAAFAVLASALIVGKGASWWGGNTETLPVVLVGGALVLVKIKRLEMVAAFLAVYVLGLLIDQRALTATILPLSLWFFVLVMLVEPLTSPSTKRMQVAFGAVVALVYFLIPKVVAGFPYALEASLLMGNLFAFSVTSSFNTIFVLKKKQKTAANTWAFYFEPMSNFNFIPGQYLEWTLPHGKPDTRGVRRYFTIASSPTEKFVMFAMKVNPEGSSFKKSLVSAKPGHEIVATNPLGDFVMPKDQKQKLCFIAGGIGVTPFRSMIKYLLDTSKKRDIVLLYSNHNQSEVSFKDVFEKAKALGIKTLYVHTERDGYITEKMIKQKVPDWKERSFYLSGPEPMVRAFKEMLGKMGVKNIKTDFFPGYSETLQK